MTTVCQAHQLSPAKDSNHFANARFPTPPVFSSNIPQTHAGLEPTSVRRWSIRFTSATKNSMKQ